MRPAEVTDEMIARWDEGLLVLKEEEQTGGIKHIRPIPDVVWYVGQWLYETLLNEGCDVELAKKIIFANGQKAAMCRSDDQQWEIAATTLKQWREGQADMPGPELARRLMEEQYGPITPQSIMRYMKDMGVDESVRTRMAGYAKRIPEGTPPDEAIAMMKQMLQEDLGPIPMTQDEFETKKPWE